MLIMLPTLRVVTLLEGRRIVLAMINANAGNTVKIELDGKEKNRPLKSSNIPNKKDIIRKK